MILLFWSKNKLSRLFSKYSLLKTSPNPLFLSWSCCFGSGTTIFPSLLWWTASIRKLESIFSSLLIFSCEFLSCSLLSFSRINSKSSFSSLSTIDSLSRSFSSLLRLWSKSGSFSSSDDSSSSLIRFLFRTWIVETPVKREKTDIFQF